ncbi:MAG: chromosomal replication initiator protein DnaA [Acidimicrobiia bacterium]|nr:chromosomal replication initiator protein DnaA [Acidimicrobiia bacterium]
MTAAQELWTSASELLRSQVSEGVWQSTFAQLSPVELTSDRLVLGMPNGIIRDKLDGRYRPLVEDALTEAAGHDVGVDFQLTVPTLFDESARADDVRNGVDGTAIDLRDPGSAGPGESPGGSGGRVDGSHAGATSLAGGGSATAVTADTLQAGVTNGSDDLEQRYTFKNFVTGPSNRFAIAAALSVAERPGGSYNPLFIYGSAGLGKTHILRAIQHFINDLEPQKKVLYVSTETFLNEFVDSIKNSSGNDFKRRYRQIDVLLVDDIQFIEGKDRLQEELFHTFNDLYGANSQIVLSSDRPPDAIPTLEDRLRSRFMMGLLTDIQPPDIETRMAILRKKSERDGYYLPNDVSEFIAANIVNNIRELEGALNKVTAFANLNGEPMTKALAEQVLGDFIADRQPRPITVAMILDATAEQFGFPIDELIGKSRRRPLVIARQMAMYVTRELTDLSFPHIAREFGGRDHTTVMHACDKISALMKERSQIYNHVMALEKSVRNQAQSVDY